MKTEKLQANQLNDKIYEKKSLFNAKLLAIGSIFLTIGIVSNISFEDKLNNFLQTTLAQNPNCSLSFDKSQVSYFPPGINLVNPVISGRCFNQPTKSIPLKNLTLNFHSPSFYPIGMRFHINIKDDNSYINAYPVVSLLSNNIKIDKTLIDSKLLANFMSNQISPISGHLSVEGFLEFKGRSLNDGEVDIISKNLTIVAQNLNGFEVPSLNLQNFQFSANVTSPNNLQINNLNLGNDQTALNASLKGKLALNQQDINSSDLNLEGNIKFSENMLESFSFLKLFLPPNKANGIYDLSINGTLGNPGMPKIQ